MIAGYAMLILALGALLLVVIAGLRGSDDDEGGDRIARDGGVDDSLQDEHRPLAA